MSHFNDVTTSYYRKGICSNSASNVQTTVYAYPYQWIPMSHMWGIPANDVWAGIAGFEPAADSIHGSRCIAAHDYDITMPPGLTATTFDEIDSIAGESNFGYEIHYTRVVFSEAVTDLPGPGFSVYSPSRDEYYILQCKLDDTSWLSIRATSADGIHFTWMDTVASLPVSFTVGSIKPVVNSFFDYIPGYTTTIANNTCTTVIGYDHTDTISTLQDSLLEGTETPAKNGYVQYLVPTTETLFAWPYFRMMTDNVPQFNATYRSIVRTQAGYVVQTDDPTKLRTVRLNGDVWVDGVTFDGVGVVMIHGGHMMRAQAVSNCVFTDAQFGIRTEIDSRSPEDGYDNYNKYSYDQLVLQNLFLNCEDGFADDLISTYFGTDAGGLDSYYDRPWLWDRKILFNTFDGGKRQVTLQRMEMCETRTDLSNNVFMNSTEYDILDSSGHAITVAIGNVSSGCGLRLVPGVDNRCQASFEFSEESGHGFRPSLASWFDNEMLSTYVPFGCEMTADITGTRPPRFGPFNFSSDLANYAASPAPQYRASSNRYVSSSSSERVDPVEANTPEYARALHRTVAPPVAYSNSAKGCFNPVIPSFGDTICFSVGRNQSNLMQSWDYMMHSDMGSGQYLTGSLGSSGFMRIFGLGSSYSVGVGDSISCEVYDGNLGSFVAITLICMQVIGPGIYIVRRTDGTKYPIDWMGQYNSSTTVRVFSIKRTYTMLQEAIDDIYDKYPDLASNAQVINLVCYDDVVVTAGTTERDIEGENGCITIPANWTGSFEGHLRIIATNSRNFCMRPQSHGGNSNRGFAIRNDSAQATGYLMTVGADTQNINVKGLRFLGETIRQPSASGSYIGIVTDATTTRIKVESSVFQNCYRGVYQ